MMKSTSAPQNTGYSSRFREPASHRSKELPVDRPGLEALDEFGYVGDITVEANLRDTGRMVGFSATIKVAVDHPVAIRKRGEMRVKRQVGTGRSKTR
jgi:hypothetical protein